MRLEDVFADVLEQPAEVFDDSSDQQNTPNWTSLANVRLLVALEGAFGVRFSNAEMATMRSLGDIRSVLATKGVAVA